MATDRPITQVDLGSRDCYSPEIRAARVAGTFPTKEMRTAPDPRRVRDNEALFPEALRPAAHDVATWMDQLTRPDAVSGLILWGSYGTGKTMLGCGALLGLAGDGFRDLSREPYDWRGWNTCCSPWRDELLVPARFIRWGNWIDRVTPYEPVPDEGPKLSRRIFADCRAIVLDEVGVTKLTEHREEWLLKFIEWASREYRALIVTTNASPDRWPEALGGRACDRIMDENRFTAVKMTGKSLRWRV
jgi:DNA replication protein DnaC